MYNHKSRKSLVASLLLLVFTSVCLQVPANAAMMTTQQIAAQQNLQADRDLLKDRLLRDDVKTELLSLGVSPDTVEDRINSLTVSELAEINGKLDTLPAGGDALTTIAVIILILILLEAAGVIDIFPKI